MYIYKLLKSIPQKYIKILNFKNLKEKKKDKVYYMLRHLMLLMCNKSKLMCYTKIKIEFKIKYNKTIYINF